MLRIVDLFAEEFDSLPALLPDREDYRVLIAAGTLVRALTVVGLGKQIYASYSAAMLHWAIGKIDDDGFLVLARHGLVTVLAATATDLHRTGFRDELIALSPDLAALPR